MMTNMIGFSQPLHSRAYNDYLASKSQNQQSNPMSAVMTAASGVPSSPQNNVNNPLDSMSFASELRSHKTVSALMGAHNPETAFPPTLQERGASIDANGNITIPKNQASGLLGTQTYHEVVEQEKNLAQKNQGKQSPAATQNNVGQQEENTRIGMPLNQGASHIVATKAPLDAIPLRQIRAFALDARSLNVLGRLAENTSDVSSKTRQQSKKAGSSEDVDSAKMNKNASIGDKQGTVGDGEKTQKNLWNVLSEQVGSLAAKYESAHKGSSVIGYDRNGGTSYGSYQISSRAGTFNEFLKFLDTKAPDWADRLRKAGDANTGSKHGNVPKEWKNLCAEDPEKMATLERGFIVKSHYEPVAQYVQEKWNSDISAALKEVIFSTAVQHGVSGAKRIFNQAMTDTKIKPISTETADAKNHNPSDNKIIGALSRLVDKFENFVEARTQKLANADTNTQKNIEQEPLDKTEKHNLNAQAELIKNIYAHRSTKFSSSTTYVQEAVRNRFISEQKDALNMLHHKTA